jgi:hypothetical protein
VLRVRVEGGMEDPLLVGERPSKGKREVKVGQGSRVVNLDAFCDNAISTGRRSTHSDVTAEGSCCPR